MTTPPWVRRRRLHVVGLVLVLLAVGAALLLAAPGPPLPAFKLYVAEDGVLRVSHEDLAQAAPIEPVPSDGLRATVGGEAVPLWIDDGGDGVFGPGDHLELVGRHLRGETTWYDEHSDFEVYRLELDAPVDGGGGPVRLAAGPITDGPIVSDRQAAADGSAPAALEGFLHLERDIVRARFRQARDETHTPTPWYWARLSQLDKPFIQELDLSTFDREARRPLELTLRFRGWSRPHHGDASIHDHEVRIHLDGKKIGEVRWNGQDVHVATLEVPWRRIDPAGTNALRIKVPKRQTADGERLVDVVLLDWIEARYPHGGLLGEGQTALRVIPSEGPPRAVRLEAAEGRTVLAYSDATRWELPAGSLARVPVDAPLRAVVDGGHVVPAAIAVDRPSALRDAEQQADYVMIVHPHLRDALEPLAAFHRERGLSVAMVDVDDIYDEFRHGRRHPEAIREFLIHAADHWAEPKPRFVLLAGDASWDTGEQADDSNYADWTYRPGELRRFIKNGSTPYDSASPVGHRNLIPTWDYRSAQGHAASDVFFVVRDPGATPLEPLMAIGRFPVVTPDEMRAVVEKTIRYARATAPGPWRQRTLWITNEQQAFQQRSDRLSDAVAEHGFETAKVYPSQNEADNAAHQQALHRAFNEGQLLVNFYGHGGRYIWRTGPADLRKNHDLFTLDDLDLLEPNDRLPVVVSLSCYSAPFDHPTADSIGEKFLRMGDRGAVAVIAASWRNSPNMDFADDLLQRLLQPGTTIGDALHEAKARTRNQTMVAMYNLLGDPALELALPENVPETSGGPIARVDPAADRPASTSGMP